jgi:hypothetical protein
MAPYTSEESRNGLGMSMEIWIYRKLIYLLQDFDIRIPHMQQGFAHSDPLPNV